ncbi:MAG: SGNH/GDSL hydrolase family protein [Saprospiraceae bacterium]|nr:SGNH/GDSL hydrolase family protein [Saprospiraceae bacterium]
MKNSRRDFIRQISAATLVAGIPIVGHATARADADDYDWYNVEDWGVEGKGWSDTTRYYDRLPARAEGVVRDKVWGLSRHSAGMCTHFVSDSASIRVRYRLFLDRIAMAHMPATGVSGVDLYARNSVGLYRWLAVTRPDAQDVEGLLAAKMDGATKHYRMYLPLYNGIDQLEIGVEKGSAFQGVAPRSMKSVVFYGTSIMHGACASRPGMSISALLGRRLGTPVINLGFSGNGRMEPEVGAFLAELDPAAFAIDCAPNMNDEMIRERAVNLIRQLHSARPNVPKLMVEDRINTNAHFRPERTDHHRRNHQALRECFEQLSNQGITNLYYLRGDDLLGHDGDGATDGSHPSDLGMVRYADAYEPVLRQMLGLY